MCPQVTPSFSMLHNEKQKGTINKMISVCPIYIIVIVIHMILCSGPPVFYTKHEKNLHDIKICAS